MRALPTLLKVFTMRAAGSFASIVSLHRTAERYQHDHPPKRAASSILPVIGKAIS
jgi:hypothetical protein